MEYYKELVNTMTDEMNNAGQVLLVDALCQQIAELEEKLDTVYTDEEIQRTWFEATHHHIDAQIENLRVTPDSDLAWDERPPEEVRAKLIAEWEAQYPLSRLERRVSQLAKFKTDYTPQGKQ